MQITKSLLLCLLINVSSSTNTNDSSNAEPSLTQKQIDSFISGLITCLDKIPVTETVAIVEDYLSSEEDIEDFGKSTLNSPNVFTLLRFSKICHDKLIKHVIEISKIFETKDAMQNYKKGQNILNKLFKTLDSLQMNPRDIINLFVDMDVNAMHQTIIKTTKKQLMDDSDMKNLLKSVIERRSIILGSYHRFVKRINENWSIRHSILPKIQKSRLYTILHILWLEFTEIISKTDITERDSATETKEIVLQATKWMGMLALSIESDVEISNFIKYVKSQELRARVIKAYNDLEIGQDFRKDEL
uniref:Tmk protein n=1 Tax=Fopius arisanus TaxID=64838 RepID=A0A0C9RDX0_9HYME